MKTKEFLKEYSACKGGAKWALSISKDMADVWNAMIEQGRHDWLLWAATRPGVFSDSVLRKLACRFVRETPLTDGRKVWDLLTDERSRKAVEVAELYADGKATYEELEAAYDAACNAAYDAACNAAYDAARAAYAAASAAYADADAAYADADDAARAACNAAYAAARAACNAAYAAARAAARAAASYEAADDDAAFAAAYAAAAARAAAAFASSAAHTAAREAARAAAARDAANADAKAAQAQMIADMGNPFKERAVR